MTDYAIQRSLNGATGWTTINDGVSTARAYTVGGLTNGTRYFFRVFVRNGVGTGPASSVANAIARTTPTAPRSLVAAPTNRSGQILLTWQPHASNGGSPVIDYVLQRSPNGTSGWTTINDGVSVANSYTVTGLANGTRFFFRVISRNAVGTGPGSNVANAIPRAITTAPKALNAIPTYVAGQVRLSWTAPSSNGGSPITDYVIQRSPNGSSGWVTINDGVSTARTYTVTGLTNGTRYYFRVYARNAVGTSAGSNIANSAPFAPRVPSAPRSFDIDASYEGLNLTWAAPEFGGGSAITYYVVQIYDSTDGWFYYDYTTGGVRSLWLEMPGYGCIDVRIAAVNASGVGQFSTYYDSCYFDLPAAPMDVNSSPFEDFANGGFEHHIWWRTPENDGGLDVTSYVLQYWTGSSWQAVGSGDDSTYQIVDSAINCLDFRVAARNALGVGPYAYVSSCYPMGPA